MQVQSCNPTGMTVDPKTYNACTFEIIDKWEPTQHAKTCDTMFYLRDGTGAYVWDCDKWIFLDFTGYTTPDWKAKEGEVGYIENKPFETLGNGLIVDEDGILNVNFQENVVQTRTTLGISSHDDSPLFNSDVIAKADILWTKRIYPVGNVLEVIGEFETKIDESESYKNIFWETPNGFEIFDSEALTGQFVEIVHWAPLTSSSLNAITKINDVIGWSNYGSIPKGHYSINVLLRAE